jgi:uncharacterized protein (DUF58 family)
MGADNGRKYLDPKVLDKLARLDLRARLIVEGFLTGEHKSPYHGFAVEFATHREYVPGDETKHIDWKVWSKTDRLYIKEYEEETNLKCTIVLDASRSMRYGREQAATKFDYGATLAACLAHLLQRQQDAVGLVIFNNRIQRNLPASSNPSHHKLLLHELEQAEPDEHTDVADVFRQLAQRIRSRGMVVLISDLFVDLPTLRQSLRHFRHRRHEVVVFHVMHDDELTFPFQDNTLFKGLEVAQELHTEPRALRKSYLESVGRFLHEARKCCAAGGIDYVLLNTKEPLDAALSRYLAFRQRVRHNAARR